MLIAIYQKKFRDQSQRSDWSQPQLQSQPKYSNLLPVWIFLVSPFDHPWLFLWFFLILKNNPFYFFRVASLCHVKCLQSHFSFTSPIWHVCCSLSFWTFFSLFFLCPTCSLSANLFPLWFFSFCLINSLHTNNFKIIKIYILWSQHGFRLLLKLEKFFHRIILHDQKIIIFLNLEEVTVGFLIMVY